MDGACRRWHIEINRSLLCPRAKIVYFATHSLKCRVEAVVNRSLFASSIFPPRLMRSRAVFIKYNSVVEAAAHYFYLVARTLTWPRDTCWAERWTIFCTFGRRSSFLASLSSQKRQKRLKRARLHTLTSAPTSDIHHHQLVMVLLQMCVFKAAAN